MPVELSEIYGQVMEDRHEGDYEIITATSKEDAEFYIRQARHFLDEIKYWMHKENWL